MTGSVFQEMEKFFKIKQSGSTIRTEIIAGLTTFFTMAYVVLVNPDIISHGDEQIFNAVFIATCISAAVGTFLMAFLANMPFAQAPGMGLNAFFAFTIMPTMSIIIGREVGLVESYQLALVLVFISGILFISITFFGIREAIIAAIPDNVKHAISGGIGLFIAYLGLQNAKIVVPSPATQVTLLNFKGLLDPETYHDTMGAIIAIIGLLIIAVLSARKVRGSIFIGIIITTIISYLPFLNYATLPDDFSTHLGKQFADFAEISLFKLDFGGLFGGGHFLQTLSTVIVIVISFSLVDLFDTIGTLLGTARKANMLNKDGTMPRMKQALMCDAIATTVGACLGSSTVTTYVESSAGVAEGGRTGLTSAVTGTLFLLALLFGPVVGLIPSVATAPSLIFVGALMIGGVTEINFGDISESVPAFLTIIMMPLTYSIANGIAFGLISYCVIKLLSGRVRDTKALTWILSLLFIIKFMMAP